MKISRAFALGSLCLLTLPAYALFGRDKIESLWPARAVQIDGRANEWEDMPVVDIHGIGFHAMNDDQNLYVLFGGTANDGRLLLSGRSRQDMTVWFLKSDGKTRDWGIDFDFTRAEDPSVTVPTKLSDFNIAPIRIMPQGMEASTTTLPVNVEVQADLSSQRGRQPIYEMRIPLSLIEHKGKSIAMDFAASDLTFEMRAELLALPPPQAPKHMNQNDNSSQGQSGGMGGGRHHRGMGTPSGESPVTNDDLPKKLNLHFSIALAKEPKH